MDIVALYGDGKRDFREGHSEAAVYSLAVRCISDLYTHQKFYAFQLELNF